MLTTSKGNFLSHSLLSAEPSAIVTNVKTNNSEKIRKLIEKAVSLDHHLAFFRPALEFRYHHYLNTLGRIETWAGSLDSFSKGYLLFGFNEVGESIIYREWAPGALEAFLIGDFNNWNRSSHPMTKDEYGVFMISLPKKDLSIGSKIKITLKTRAGSWIDRLPAWITRSEYNPSTNLYEAVYIPKAKYEWKYHKPAAPSALRIYEAHIGIATSESKVGSYKEFTATIVPRVARLGYNCIQLMAIMEHAYYASFGYQVTSFFAPSSRYGSIDDLKELIDEAHKYGIIVFLDIVHSHASKNTLDGLNELDGTDSCYFHSGDRGVHSLWDSRLFNYGEPEVLRFLLSNLRWWLDEFQFDGFRFDGITSLLYYHHGIAYGFSGDYANEYYGNTVDWDALVYLQLANEMLHQQGAISIAEDVSGMPLLCRKVAEGGIGFDYRLNMAVPDLWIKFLKEGFQDVNTSD